VCVTSMHGAEMIDVIARGLVRSTYLQYYA
jgi:hypothetical protein